MNKLYPWESSLWKTKVKIEKPGKVSTLRELYLRKYQPIRQYNKLNRNVLQGIKFNLS